MYLGTERYFTHGEETFEILKAEISICPYTPLQVHRIMSRGNRNLESTMRFCLDFRKDTSEDYDPDEHKLGFEFLVGCVTYGFALDLGLDFRSDNHSALLNQTPVLKRDEHANFTATYADETDFEGKVIGLTRADELAGDYIAENIGLLSLINMYSKIIGFRQDSAPSQAFVDGISDSLLAYRSTSLTRLFRETP